jgi:pyruvate,water dikinase
VKVLIRKNYVNDSYIKEYARKLELDIPLNLTVIDFAIRSLDNQGKLTLDTISSPTLRTFAEGMCIPGLWARDPVAVDIKSFMSSMTRTFSANAAAPNSIGQNLAVASGDYLNVSLHLGYHFSMIDTVSSDKDNDNYIYFRFFGGVTDQTRRSRRAQLIQQILSQNDFMTSTKGDLVVARIKGASRQHILAKIFILGALVSFTRQLDVRMINDTTIAQFVQEFQSVLQSKETTLPEDLYEPKQTC